MHWGYNGSQGMGYKAIVSFVVFVAGGDQVQAYFAFISGSNDTETFDFRDPLVYQALIKKDPDLPGYMEAMTGDDQEGFYEAM